MREDPSRSQQLSDMMLQTGYPPAVVPFVKFRSESEETVDRDYGGNWAEANEMPQIASESD